MQGECNKETNKSNNKQTNKQRIGETLFDDWGGVRLKDGASFLMQGKCNKQTNKKETNKQTNKQTSKQTNKQTKGKKDLMTGVRLKESQLPHAGRHDGPESDSIEMGWLW